MARNDILFRCLQKSQDPLSRLRLEPGASGSFMVGRCKVLTFATLTQPRDQEMYTRRSYATVADASHGFYGQYDSKRKGSPATQRRAGTGLWFTVKIALSRDCQWP